MYYPKMSPDAQPSLPPADLHDATRRRFLAVSTAAGLGSTLFPGALLALAGSSAAAQSSHPADSPSEPAITSAMIEQAAAIAGLTFTDEQRQQMIEGLTGVREDVVTIRKLNLPNAVAPSLVFDPVPGGTVLDRKSVV